MESLVEIEKILVPVDYSEHSIQACRYALKLSLKANALVKIFHAFYSPAYDLIELSGKKSTQQKLREEVTQKLITGEKEKLQEFINTLSKYPEYRKTPGEKIETVIIPGLAKEEILRIAANFMPHLVVMGTRGKDAKENSILGSITEFAINKLQCPVMAVPVDYTFIGESNIKNIAYLTDFDESDFLSIKKLMGFISNLGLTIHCLHIGGKSGKWEKIKMEGLRDYFRNSYDTTKVECHILDSDKNTLQAIDDYVKEKKINILSLTRRRRNLIEKVFKPSLTKRLFYHSNIPLLVFHS
jgi:nucleotide-binding universal stress UspA family protein